MADQDTTADGVGDVAVVILADRAGDAAVARAVAAAPALGPRVGPVVVMEDLVDFEPPSARWVLLLDPWLDPLHPEALLDRLLAGLAEQSVVAVTPVVVAADRSASRAAMFRVPAAVVAAAGHAPVVGDGLRLAPVHAGEEPAGVLGGPDRRVDATDGRCLLLPRPLLLDILEQDRPTTPLDLGMALVDIGGVGLVTDDAAALWQRSPGARATSPADAADHGLDVAAARRWGADLFRRARPGPPRIGIRNPAPAGPAGARWGDTPYAHALRDAWERAGFVAEVQPYDDWETVDAHTFDVVVHLRGVRPSNPGGSATDVLWIISHPEDVTDAELDAHDLVLVASGPFAEVLRERTDTPVEVLHQATDTRRFRPRPPSSRLTSAGIVVVANGRWPVRQGTRWLVELGHEFALYGAGWRYLEARHVVAEHVRNEDLPDVYAEAAIVVADQWPLMAREGFVANRLFDVAAAGGFVVSDAGVGVTEVFGDLVPQYGDRDELGAVLDRYLHDAPARAALSTQAMLLVREQHGFDQRVASICGLLDLRVPA